MKVVLPFYIKEDAEKFADEEVRQLKRNPSRSNPAWKKAFDRYVREAYEHSLVPARTNPGTPKISKEIDYQNYPEIFGSQGFISQITNAEPLTAEWEQIADRIRSAVANLVQLYAQYVMAFKINRDKKFDLADKKSLSIFEFAKKSGKSDSQIDDELIETVSAQYYRYLIENIIYNLLIPFFETSEKDIHQIMESTNIGQMTIGKLQDPEIRQQFVQALRKRLEKPITRKESILKLFIP